MVGGGAWSMWSRERGAGSMEAWSMEHGSGEAGSGEQ